MSLGKLNYDTLNENLCYWYYKVYKKFPPRSMIYTRAGTVRMIWILKRKYARIMRGEEVEVF